MPCGPRGMPRVRRSLLFVAARKDFRHSNGVQRVVGHRRTTYARPASFTGPRDDEARHLSLPRCITWKWLSINQCPGQVALYESNMHNRIKCSLPGHLLIARTLNHENMKRAQSLRWLRAYYGTLGPQSDLDASEVVDGVTTFCSARSCLWSNLKAEL